MGAVFNQPRAQGAPGAATTAAPAGPWSPALATKGGNVDMTRNLNLFSQHAPLTDPSHASRGPVSAGSLTPADRQFLNYWRTTGYSPADAATRSMLGGTGQQIDDVLNRSFYDMGPMASYDPSSYKGQLLPYYQKFLEANPGVSPHQSYNLMGVQMETDPWGRNWHRVQGAAAPSTGTPGAGTPGAPSTTVPAQPNPMDPQLGSHFGWTNIDGTPMDPATAPTDPNAPAGGTTPTGSTTPTPSTPPASTQGAPSGYNYGGYNNYGAYSGLPPTLTNAWQDYLYGGGSDTQGMWHPGPGNNPSFNASGTLQAQRSMAGYNNSGWTPYGGYPGQGQMIGMPRTSSLNYSGMRRW